MSDETFALSAERTLEQILGQLEGNAPEVEADLVDSVLTLELPDSSTIVLNRQEAVEQIWLACSDGPARFQHTDRGWRDTQTDQELGEVLGTLIGRRLGRTLQIRL
ncbi:MULTISPECIES: iron donor protein CyaY [Acidithiobacillus]|jgi:CyaY protein|uniref:Iron donor protein CyaY n=3 Tax=Acidithiobacillus caldus TaxID=33059 RepID=F9ZMJ2_ACICS|nr:MULTISPECIES: iron donor protein CyaY [Acidithiobacillus]AEK57381.1 iron donor protein CyaY [Acidithiobacillus caldus SM-1]AIA54640.1 iron donor protein CyaY [Acidithiobacillus caldus ATCC 51756]AUW32126.1 iron donor protein CyaY [Acidithiobacillus caldus]MBU2728956.1 iron donor protein CyaY [Acidithiobacillus caldus]MBU2735880.1 iron donor protein CyaY [Acidithiobacillus caldus ATCC 51756]